MNIKAAAMLAALAMTIPSDMSASYPNGYYDSLEGKCGAELMAAIKAKVGNHKEISYGSSTWNAFKDTDVRTVDGVDYWWDMYSSNLVEVSSGHSGLNIEHSVANSWWGKTKNAAYMDIVHLNPSDAEANNKKANYPLTELETVSWTNGVTSIGSPKAGQGGGSGWGYEPADEYKGDFARVFMYMFTVYDDIAWKSNTNWMYNTSSATMFRPWASTLLLRWSADDPVSAKERSRNDGVYIHQQNRNPFIDLPDLAEHIWGSKSNVPYSLSGTPGPGPDDPDDPEDPGTGDSYLWLASTSPSMDADWTVEEVTLPSAGSYIWSWKEIRGTYYLNASAYIGGTPYESEGYAWSPEVSFENVTKATVSFMHAARYQTTLKDYCTLVVKDTETGEITPMQVTGWPEKNTWNFASSGDIDLSAFTGKKVKVGFRYKSDTTGADTWEINDVKLDLVRNASSSVGSLGDADDDSFLVEVWGNNILAPEGARIFDLNGREFDWRGLQRGVYIVVKPTFERAVKVYVK